MTTAGRAWLAALALALGLSGPAAAQGPEYVATYSTSNGTVPPPFHWRLDAAISADGMVTVRHCTGYDDTGCGIATAPAPEGAVAAIMAAVRQAGLVERPAAQDSHPPVGGSATSGSVLVDGRLVLLPAFPAPEDRQRVGAVLNLLGAVIPSEARAAAAAAAP